MAAPAASSRAYGFASVPREVHLWQGTGLAICLFGFGYALASLDPVRNWSVVAVGLLSKILGPIGMSWAVVEGRVSSDVLVLLPVNDLIWWIPFALILRRAWIVSHSRSGG